VYIVYGEKKMKDNQKIWISKGVQFKICDNCTYPNNMWRTKCYMCEEEV